MRTSKFASGIRRLINGRGVDFVLNSLTGELLDESWRLLSDNGMLLEIGKKDIVNRNSLPMEPFDRNCSYHGIDIVKPSISDDLALVEKTVQTIRSLLVAGRIGPILPMKTFSFSQIPDATRYMRPGEHMGKIVILDGDAHDVKVPIRRAAPPFTLYGEHAYLIVGGLKGLCGSLAVYMARHGARNLIVMSRSGLDDDTRCVQVVRDLKNLGVVVKIEKGDVSYLQDVVRVFIHLCGGTCEACPCRGSAAGQLPFENAVYFALEDYPPLEPIPPLNNAVLDTHTSPDRALHVFHARTLETDWSIEHLAYRPVLAAELAGSTAVAGAESGGGPARRPRTGTDPAGRRRTCIPSADTSTSICTLCPQLCRGRKRAIAQTDASHETLP